MDIGGEGFGVLGVGAIATDFEGGVEGVLTGDVADPELFPEPSS